MQKMKDIRDAQNLPSCIEGRKAGYSNMPVVFSDRILKLGILSFSVLLFGCFMGIQMKSRGFIFWSVILGAEIFAQALWLLHIAFTGRYEVVEGMVLEITGRSFFTKFQKIKIVFADERETELLLGKSVHMEKGSWYKFYFNSGQNVLSGIKTVDAALNTGSFYGLEKISRKEGDRKM